MAATQDAFGEHFKSQGGSGAPDNIDLLQIASSAEEAAAQLLKAGISPKRVQVDDEMAFKVWGDLEAGFKTLESVGPRVAIYGSSKHAPNDPFCKLAGRLGHLLGEEKIPVVTCGASALTNSVNAAAKFAGGRSVGISSQHEPSPNGHVTDSIRTTYNCTAKVLATRGATTSIFFPGGFQTMDAVFEVLTLHQTGKSDETPTVFVGRPWHVVKAGLKTMLDAGTIEKRDIDRIMVVEKAEHAFDIARASVQKARQQLA
ncbi:MAG: LOG family protein [Bdellovibrionota bacterium]|nr:MAG: LOG family protein [Bdellovibrionota bacterium]